MRNSWEQERNDRERESERGREGGGERGIERGKEPNKTSRGKRIEGKHRDKT
jgi:hypothetical protein